MIDTLNTDKKQLEEKVFRLETELEELKKAPVVITTPKDEALSELDRIMNGKYKFLAFSPRTLLENLIMDNQTVYIPRLSALFDHQMVRFIQR